MTELEWLTSKDPAAMLTWLLNADGGIGLQRLRPSDRKLRLFAEAAGCKDCEETAGPLGPTRYAEYVLGCPDWADRRVAQASILRDIVGNPFRPVTLPKSNDKCKRCNGKGDVPAGAGGATQSRPMRVPCDKCGGRGWRSHPWLTPTVLSLATVAYEGRETMYTATIEGSQSPCWIDDGTLDPLTLAALADAMEEAVCTDEALLRHLRGFEPCHGCVGILAPTTGGLWPCRECGANCWAEHGWRALSGPHVRGCWALDLILGKK